ncbi:GDSL-type esterase/lipase family protein [Bacillus infantis]|uniref:GDSL-type esterase/lipase family protein n=1 Tax=Bacillus infantis TaxID=324767 RepID=UPI001CD5AD92|nr:GDSL-type esterase/lipase family protein [Bacillus infantis]MCA1040026.1 GDSL-type esterase/lipase family protein [Bacillus infantis]
MDVKKNLLNYTAVGDSITAGVGASFFSPGFVPRFARLAEESLGRRVVHKTYARPGALSGEVLEAVRSPAVSNALAGSDLITITAGGNDLIQGLRSYLLTKNEKDLSSRLNLSAEKLSGIVEHITELKSDSPEPYMVYLLNLYNPVAGEETADRWIRKFNKQLQQLCDHHHFRTVNIFQAFKGNENDLVAMDRVHPNDSGYNRIAEKIKDTGYGLLICQ